MKHIIFLFTLLVVLMTGCNSSDSPDIKPDNKQENDKAKHLALVYAVNKNNLSGCLLENNAQMLEVLSTLPAGESTVVVFQTFLKKLEDGTTQETAGLFQAVSGQKPEFKLIKEYSRSILSTDPKRMAEVFNDVSQMNAEKKSLFFWGHGMAWTPYFSSHISGNSDAKSMSRSGLNIGEAVEVDMPELTAFGGDLNSTDWADIDEIREALPKDVFEMIWFDCCYMSNIETVYELKDKCRWMVAYPTEIAAKGLPYNRILPFIFSDEYDLKGAAKTLVDYYVLKKTPVTVAVLDMTKIGKVVDVCGKIYRSGSNLPSYYGLQNYSTHRPAYYDLMQYAREYAQANDAEYLINDLYDVMDDFIVFADASERGFDGKQIVKENFSGISTHLLNDKVTKEEEEYYRGLSWYKDTYMGK